MGKKSWMPAEEFRRELESDPAWVAQRDSRRVRFAERAQVAAADEATLIAELLSIGVPVTSIYDYVGKQALPTIALPILVKHLDILHHPAIREGLIRALGIPDARQLAFEPLKAVYLNERDPHHLWLTANALSGMAQWEEVAHLPGIEAYAPLFA